MHRSLRAFAVLAAMLPLSAHSLWAQAGRQVMRYQGTIGQRHAGLTLEVEGDTLASVRYEIDQQPGEIAMSEIRVFGTTIVMADDDGNLFHLHLQDSVGHTATDFQHAEGLAGTMQRGEDVDLTVKFSRMSETAAK